jgi:hypothetical protein
MDTLGELKKVSREIAAIDEKRSNKLAERDQLIARARDEKIPWLVMQEASGLSARAIQQALARVQG